MDYDKLSDDELNDLIHEKVFDETCHCAKRKGVIIDEGLGANENCDFHVDSCGRVPHYISNLDASFKVQAKINDLGLEVEFISELENILEPKSNQQVHSHVEWMWLVFNASAKDRCIAALKARNPK